MDLRNGDCLDIMKDLEKESVDLLFADLPYGQTSCKWDCLIDLDLFWKEVNRVCKKDAPMIFTCSVKFGNLLINSNPKNFRYDLVWVKSAPCGFLNAKKMPMKKHEMIYIFYRKLPKVYTENIALHHTHKFLKEDNKIVKRTDKGCDAMYGKETNKVFIYDEKGKLRNSEPRYEPPLPNSIIKEEENCKYDVNKNAYGGGKEGRIKISKAKRDHEVRYEPPLPNSIIKEDTGVYNECDHSSSKKLIRDTKNYTNETIYEPPLPNSLLEMKSEKGKHATQKPVTLMEWVLKYYSREGDVVLDATMGSGSMGVACKNMKRSFIGIEKDEEIFKIAQKRCN